MRILSACITFLLALIAASSIQAQITPMPIPIPDTTAAPKVRTDTILFIPRIDTSLTVPVVDSVNLERHLYQNPTVALFKSMFVPGLGQIGNRRYIKAVAVIGLQVWFIGNIIHHGRNANTYWKLYQGPLDTLGRNYFYGLYATERDQRNKYTWFAGIVTFVSMFDAYVDAQLSGSPTAKRNRKFTADVLPDFRGGARAQLALTF